MKTGIGHLGSTALTVVLLVLLAGVSAYGSMLPARLSAGVFGSAPFHLLCAALFVNISLGLVARLRRGACKPHAVMIRLAVLLIILGAFLGRQFGSRAYVQLYEGQQADSFTGRGGGILRPGFSLRLDRFSVERYPGGRKEIAIRPPNGATSFYPVAIGRETGPPEMRVRPLRYVPDMRIGAGGRVTSASSRPNNPALEVEVTAGGWKERGWLLARFPHFPPPGLKRTLRAASIVFIDHASGNIKSYESEISIFRGGRKVASARVLVNSPVKYGGYRIYQSAYDPVGWQWSGFEIVRDPGLPLVYAGYALLALGITLWAGTGNFD